MDLRLISISFILIDRMGGRKVTKVRVLRTCAVGESNIDRTIGDLMTESNPTVGLAAHAGQTDVRIAAKADTGEEADALIAPMEAELRKRLGVAIYGTAKETVAEVVGNLLNEKGFKIGIVDTLTNGQVMRELEENGVGDVIASHAQDVGDVAGDPRTQAEAIAKDAAPEGGVGLAMVGPFEDNLTFMAVY